LAACAVGGRASSGEAASSAGRQSFRGFTLIELLVVIGIIVVLIAMLMPSLNKARAAAMAVQCASNEQQIFLGFTLYAGDNRGFIPPILGFEAQGSPSWADYLWGGNAEGFIGQRYLTTSEVFFCPAQYYRQWGGSMSNGAFRGNYGMNKQMMTDAYGNMYPGVAMILDPYYAPTSNSAKIYYYKLAATFRPTEVYLLGDAPLASLTSQEMYINNSSVPPDFRHAQSQVQMLFHDGHVEKLPVDEVPMSYSYFPPWWPPTSP
jgi:prepilin-type N-terminal cleavage/methylation domain-containing protein/prepilin-type processing-associated H-X9-DG protein